MTMILNGTTGISDVDGSASTPAIRGTDTNTGMFFPAADTIAFAEGGAEVARFDSSGNLGVGTSTPNGKTSVAVASNRQLDIFNDSASDYTTLRSINQGSSNTLRSLQLVGEQLLVSTGASSGTTYTERMRIDSSGNFIVGKTTTSDSTEGLCFTSTKYLSIVRVSGAPCYFNRQGSSGDNVQLAFQNTQVGSISVNTGTTAYNTSSDYRLKDNVAPMTGALTKVAQLKPVTYTWKADGSSGEGFIAHELAEVVPQAVTGEKDAVNEDGSIKPQGIDTSFLVATLTAAIQEQQAQLTDMSLTLANANAIINELKTRIETLEQANAA